MSCLPEASSATTPWCDPNAALWASIRPAPPPPWHEQLREQIGTLALGRQFEAVSRSVLTWVASPLTALGWLLGISVGIALGYAFGLPVRPSPDAMTRREPSAQLALRPPPSALGGSSKPSSNAPLNAPVAPAPMSDGAAAPGADATLVPSPQPTVHVDVAPGRVTKRRTARFAAPRAERRHAVSRARKARLASVARSGAKRESSHRSKWSVRSRQARAGKFSHHRAFTSDRE